MPNRHNHQPRGPNHDFPKKSGTASGLRGPGNPSELRDRQKTAFHAEAGQGLTSGH